MRNKLSISNIAWTRSEDDKVYLLMQQYGFGNLEIAPSRIWDNPYEQTTSEKERFKELLRTYGISVAAFQSLLFNRPDLTLFTSKESREALFEHLSKNIILAKELGAKALVFGSPKNRVIGNIDKQTAHNISLEFFSRIGEHAAENGVFFCIEPNPHVYGTDFICTTEDAIDLVRTVDHPNLRLNIDLGTIRMNDESLEKTIVQAIPYARHFHISEPFLEKIILDQEKHKQIRTILEKTPYHFVISIEMKTPEETERLSVIESTLAFVSDTYGSNDSR